MPATEPSKDIVYANTPAWDQLRCGIPTGSRAGDVMSRKNFVYRVVQRDENGNKLTISEHRDQTVANKTVDRQRKAGYHDVIVQRIGTDKTAEWKAYFVEKFVERLTGDLQPHVVTDAMRWGIEKEAEAIAKYGVRTGYLTETGYLIHCGDWACTPDAFVLGEPGIVSIKCPMSHNFLDAMVSGHLEPQFFWQLIAEMRACPDCEWVDLALYDPRFGKDPRNTMFIRRFYRDDHLEALRRCREGFDEFIERLDAAEEAWEPPSTIKIIPNVDF